MATKIVPLVLIPRFTTYVGEAVYVTVGLNVSAFQQLIVTMWRGPLVGAPASGAALSAQLEVSPDNETWTSVLAPITTADGHTVLELAVDQPWVRLRMQLTDDANGVVAVTCWANGFLEVREAA